MALLRSQVEYILLRRCGKKLAYAGLDATTADGTNADLTDPIGDALSNLGLAPANIVVVADADLAGVLAADMGRFLDIAELRLLENILGNRAAPDQIADTANRQDHGKFYLALETTIKRKQAALATRYGIGLPTLTANTFTLGFGQAIDPLTGRPI